MDCALTAAKNPALLVVGLDSVGTCELSTTRSVLQMYATMSYVPTHEVQTITVTTTDNNTQAGLLGRIFKIPTGTLTLTQTSPNPTTNNAGFLAAVNASSNSAQLALNVGGINYIKVFCDMSQGYKAAQVSWMFGHDTVGCYSYLRSSWKLGILRFSCDS